MAYPVTDKFKRSIVYDHKMVAKAELWEFGGSQAAFELDIVAGRVDVEDRDINRNFNVTLTDPTGDLTPDDVTDFLAPMGNEIRLYRGIDYQDGTDPELCSLGVFGIADNEITDSGENFSMVVSGYDRSRKVSRAKFADWYPLATGITYDQAIIGILEYTVPQLNLDYSKIVSTGTTVPPGTAYEIGKDPLKAIKELAAAVGCYFEFDLYGQPVLQYEPDPTLLVPVFEYTEGDACIILSLQRHLDDEDTYNGAIIRGNNPNTSTAPPLATVWDDNPNSPTYYLGQYGRVPYIPDPDPLVTTAAQANDVAIAELRKRVGTTEKVWFPGVCNPMHEIRDAISIVRTKSKINAVYLIDSINYGMAAGDPMNITCRERSIWTTA